MKIGAKSSETRKRANISSIEKKKKKKKKKKKRKKIRGENCKLVATGGEKSSEKGRQRKAVSSSVGAKTVKSCHSGEGGGQGWNRNDRDRENLNTRTEGGKRQEGAFPRWAWGSIG